MLNVDMPVSRKLRAAKSSPGHSVVSSTGLVSAGGVGASLGLKQFEYTAFAPVFTPRSKVLKDTDSGDSFTAEWLDGLHGVTTNPLEPALPLFAINVTPPAGSAVVLRGVGFRGGAYTDESPLVPLTGAPATEIRGVHVPFLTPTFFPMRMWTPNYYDALGRVGRLDPSPGDTSAAQGCERRGSDGDPARLATSTCACSTATMSGLRPARPHRASAGCRPARPAPR